MSNRTPPPAQALFLVEVIGEAATIALLDAAGGTRVYVPRRAGTESLLARMIGAEAADRMVASFGGDLLTLPLCREWRALRMYEGGASHAAIARKTGLTERAVYRMTQRLKASALQGGFGF